MTDFNMMLCPFCTKKSYNVTSKFVLIYFSIELQHLFGFILQ